MFPDVTEDIKDCVCGKNRIENNFGFVYCPGCDTFFCPQCDAPLDSPKNDIASCAKCNNGVAKESLVRPI